MKDYTFEKHLHSSLIEHGYIQGFTSRQDHESLDYLNKAFMPKEGFWWFLEDRRTHMWLCNDGTWTNDPHKCLKWDLECKAWAYSANNCPYPERQNYTATEHEFSSPPNSLTD